MHIDYTACSIKLYAWEKFFMAKILQVRNEQELRLLKKIGIANVRKDIRINVIKCSDTSL